MSDGGAAAPIIPWIGGKSRLYDRIVALMPPHTCYVELFAGGAAVFLRRPVAAKSEILNDVNGDLINLYRVVQSHLDEFVRQFDWSLNSRAVFENHQSHPAQNLTDIQRAARFFYLQCNCFGGKVEGQTFGVDSTGGGGSRGKK
jgi:DNA adenine methylase